MSAWLVSKAHIDAMLMVAMRIREAIPMARGWRTYDSADEIGRMLWAENARSLAARYGDKEDPQIAKYRAPIFTLHELAGRLNHAAALKAIACYEYQSCEHAEWPASDAHAWCRALRSIVIASLPGYEDAPWGIENPRALLTTAEA